MSTFLLSTLFLGLALAMAGVVIGLFSRYLNGRDGKVATGILVVWLAYVGIMGYAGVARSSMPPGLLLLVVPVVLFNALFLTRHSGVRVFERRDAICRSIVRVHGGTISIASQIGQGTKVTASLPCALLSE